ncbi:hypothetical protein pv_304 [Pithovirus sibericum]|uniref:Uncharacterized protein n=1 Tax=Pithovirus sibericum TaxID=1450746 RepID=W5S571_9VIRU|nr:hypothetical protein pv_304 [Pithovirus sibericum]AHH01871.1 hypothetical protein pv_304 [Pithovirus sibericum]
MSNNEKSLQKTRKLEEEFVQFYLEEKERLFEQLLEKFKREQNSDPGQISFSPSPAEKYLKRIQYEQFSTWSQMLNPIEKIEFVNEMERFIFSSK